MSWRDLIALRSVKMADAGAEEVPSGVAEPVESNDNLESADDGMWDDILTSVESDDSEQLEQLDGTTDDVVTPVETTEPTIAEVPAGQEPVVEPVVEPAVVAEPVVEPVVPATEPEQSVVAEPQPAQVQTPEQQQAVRQQMMEARGKVVDQLSDMYALSDEESETLQLEPEKILPRLAAQVHMNVIEALTEGIQSQLPQMIKAVSERGVSEDKSVDAFYEAWPDLKGDDKQAAVLRVMQGYRASNPQATQEQVIREGGAMAMVALQLPINTAPAPITPAASTPAHVPVQPAMPGSAVVPSNTADASNPYAQMFIDATIEDV